MILLFQVVLSIIIGGTWVVLSTIISEKVGEKYGGLVSGAPSTILIAYVFIGFTQGTTHLYNVTTTLPAIFSVNALFLYTYWRLTASEKNSIHKFSILLSISIWGLAQLIIVILLPNSFYISISVWLVVMVLVVLFINKEKKPSRKVDTLIYTRNQLIYRFILAGVVIGSTVIMSKVGGAHIGGIFASLPAVFLSTLYLIEKQHGKCYARSLVPFMMLSGISSVVIFSTLVRIYMSHMNYISAITLAYFITIFIGLILFHTIPALIKKN